MADITAFVSSWASTISTLGLIGVTVWYAFQTQGMARSARESAESSRLAAEYSARSAAVAVAGTIVDFEISPTYAFEIDLDGMPFKGVRIQSAGAAVFVHSVEIDEAWAIDSDSELDGFFESVQAELFGGNSFPPLHGLDDAPMLMHKDEFAFLEFPRPSWTECTVATLTLAINYSFDGKQPLRRRYVEWERPIDELSESNPAVD